jgi:hypothetical protein
LITESSDELGKETGKNLLLGSIVQTVKDGINYKCSDAEQRESQYKLSPQTNLLSPMSQYITGG